MNLLGTPDPDDLVAQKIIDEIGRVNNLTATQEHPEWVNVQVSYRLKDLDATFREASVMRQQAAEVPEILSRLAQHVKLAYGQVSAEVLTGGTRRRFMTFDVTDVLYIDVVSEPYEPEQTQDDERRAKLRGRRTNHGVYTSAVEIS